MKEKINILIDKIGLIFLCIIIVLLNIYIGSNVTSPIYIIQILSITFGVIFAITKKIVSKENVFVKGNIDIFVILLVISTMIPLIFKTWASFNEALNFIIKYITMYSIYIVTRNVITTKKQIKIIANTIIISSIIVIILALDILYFQNSLRLLEKINAVIIPKNVLVGTFGYPNTMALYMSLNLFIATACFFEDKKIAKKIMYGLYMLVSFICIILTNSRSVISLVIAIIIGFLIVKYRKKMNKKHIIILLICSLIGIGTTIFLMQFSKPVDITEDVQEYEIRNLHANQEYTLNFDIYTNTQKEENNEVFKIEIVEVSRYTAEEVIAEVSFSDYDDIKTLTIKPSEDVYVIRARFINTTKEKFVINKLNINEKEYILNYKYVPNKFAKFVNTFNPSNISIWQRADYYYDGLKIIKENWLLGAGGNAWICSYERVHEYNYAAKEVHSYPLEIWMSFGLLGMISFILIIIITIENIYKMIKAKAIDNLLMGIIIGTILIILHSFVDFGMSFLIILVLIYMFIAIINKQDKGLSTQFGIVDYAAIILLVLANVVLIRQIYVIKKIETTSTIQQDLKTYSAGYQYKQIMQLVDERDNEEQKLKEILKRTQKLIALEPNREQQTVYNIYAEILIELINEENIEEQLENIQYIKNLWNSKPAYKFVIVDMIDRANDINNLISKLIKIYKINPNEQIKTEINQLYAIFTNQYKNNVLIMLDYKRNMYTKEYAERRVLEYLEIYNKITEKVKQVI